MKAYCCTYIARRLLLTTSYPPTTTLRVAAHRHPTRQASLSLKMAEVWFWLVIMIAAVLGVMAVIIHVHSGGAREFAVEMRGPKAEGDPDKGGDEETPTEAAAA